MRNLTVISALLLVLVCAALAWGVYWFVGAGAKERALDDWLAARRGEGWTASVSALDTRGFPNRFDTTLETVELDDPDTGVGWSAPWFQILALSYRPTELIAAWPEEQALLLPGQTLDIVSERMIGSLKLRISPDVPFERLVIEGTGVEIGSSADWSARVAAAQFALRESPGAGTAPVYDIALSLSGFAPESADVTRLRDLVVLPEAVEALAAEMTVTFDRGWDRGAIEDRRPQPREIALTKLEASWGDLALAGSGEIMVDEDGVGTGTIALEATNWRDMLALAEASGALPANQAPLVRAALETIAALAGDPERLDVSLRFTRGLVFLGPVPLGTAPRFALP